MISDDELKSMAKNAVIWNEHPIHTPPPPPHPKAPEMHDWMPDEVHDRLIKETVYRHGDFKDSAPYPSIFYDGALFMFEVLTEEKWTSPERVKILTDALEFYAQPRRDTSFPGWEKEWRLVEIKHESDYEYYPNHDVAVEALAEFRKGGA